MSTKNVGSVARGEVPTHCLIAVLGGLQRYPSSAGKDAKYPSSRASAWLPQLVRLISIDVNNEGHLGVINTEIRGSATRKLDCGNLTKEEH